MTCVLMRLGSSVSISLVEGMARAGNGISEIVSPNERMEPKVMRLVVDNVAMVIILSVKTCDECHYFIASQLENSKYQIFTFRDSKCHE